MQLLPADLVPVRVAVDDPLRPDVRALIEAHLAFAAGESPPEHVHALGSEHLGGPTCSLFSARAMGTLVAVGALQHLDAGHGELKSMHTAASARGRGVGRAMVTHLMWVAGQRGYRRLSLETGTSEAFAAARALYLGAGFRPCPPFNGYTENPFSICMTTEIGRGVR